MELKRRKYLNNTRRLPGFDIGKGAGGVKFQLSGFKGDASELGSAQQGGIIGGFDKMDVNKARNIMGGGNYTFQPTAQQYGAQNNMFSAGQQAASNIPGKGGQIASSAISHIGAIANAFGPVQSQGELISEAGEGVQNVNGVNYNEFNSIDESAKMKELSRESKHNTLNTTATGASLGASIGSIFPGWGTVIGGALGAVGGFITGLFGGSKRKRKMERRLDEARNTIVRHNNFARSGANTRVLENNYSMNNPYTQDGLLYARRGKDLPMFNRGKNKVWTPDGYMNAPTNSVVGKGESIYNQAAGTATLVTKGKKGVDNQPSSVHPHDDNIIFGNDKDMLHPNRTSFADQAAPLSAYLQRMNELEKKAGKFNNLSSLSKSTKELQTKQLDKIKAPVQQELDKIAQRQEFQHKMQNIRENRPHYAGGKGMDISGAIVDTNSMLMALGQYLWAKKQKLSTPDVYAVNPYSSRALNGLAGLQANAYPLMQQMYDAERRGQYSINNSGGMTGGQRQNNRVALALGSQRNIANVLSQTQAQNNAYRDQYYRALLQQGEADAQRKQSANQYNYEALRAAHNARHQQVQMAMYNMLQAQQQMAANQFKYKTWQDTIDMYRQQYGGGNNGFNFGGLGKGGSTGASTASTPATVTTGSAAPTRAGNISPANLVGTKGSASPWINYDTQFMNPNVRGYNYTPATQDGVPTTRSTMPNGVSTRYKKPTPIIEWGMSRGTMGSWLWGMPYITEFNGRPNIGNRYRMAK